MDRKSLIVLIICGLLLFLWPALVNRLYPPIPVSQDTNAVTQIDPQPTPSSSGLTNGIPAPETPPPAGTLAETAPFIPPTEPEQTLAIENDKIRCTFTSHGGGIKFVELKGYPATVTCRNTETNALAALNAPSAVPVLSLLGAFDRQPPYKLSRTTNGVRAETTLTNGLQIIKEFRLATNYQLTATVRLQNQGSEAVPIPAQEWVVGTSTPIGKANESLSLGFEWYDGRSAERIAEPYFANKTLGCFPGRPRSLYQAGSSNVVWAAVHNQFFTLIAIPSVPAPQILGRKVNLPPPTPEELKADPNAFAQPYGYQTSLLYPASVLRPNEEVERSFEFFAGPKEYNTLSRLEHNVDLIMNFDGFFGFFAKALLLSMNGIHALGISYGLSIVVITILIKLLFWPLTNASTKSMKRMAALQPQMKAIQEKYKDDPRKMNMKLMEFMKQNKVSPLGGCLPMLLQIPVFFGFYKMLQSAIELRGAQFLWACDLSRPDTVFVIPGLNFPINPMPLLMGATMLWQARLTPVSPGMDPVQQKIMKYMPLMFMVFLYNFSAGLTLYWTVQNLLTIAQMKLTRSTGSKSEAEAKPIPSPKPPGKKK